MKRDGNDRPVIAVTMGDPSGVGPEIVAAALSDPEIGEAARVVVVGDAAALARGISVAGTPLRLERLGERLPDEHSPGVLYMREISALAEADMPYGAPGEAAGKAVFRAIVTAAEMCLAGAAEGMATAPISKSALNRAGHHYPGHTELLAELTGAENFVMMLAGKSLRVALVTIHEALRDVPRLLTRERILDVIRTTHADVHRFFCRNPRIAVLALNPHCGEGGLFGDEEHRHIRPAIEAARREGINAAGPLSADTLFHFASRGDYDAVVCMYHDQGLIPIKLLHFEDAVNVTLGLPIIRTSVDHGTAYDVAGTGKASPASMKAAIRMAAEMALLRRQA